MYRTLIRNYSHVLSHGRNLQFTEFARACATQALSRVIRRIKLTERQPYHDLLSATPSLCPAVNLFCMHTYPEVTGVLSALRFVLPFVFSIEILELTVSTLWKQTKSEIRKNSRSCLRYRLLWCDILSLRHWSLKCSFKIRDRDARVVNEVSSSTVDLNCWREIWKLI